MGLRNQFKDGEMKIKQILSAPAIMQPTDLRIGGVRYCHCGASYIPGDGHICGSKPELPNEDRPTPQAGGGVEIAF